MRVGVSDGVESLLARFGLAIAVSCAAELTIEAALAERRPEGRMVSLIGDRVGVDVMVGLE